MENIENTKELKPVLQLKNVSVSYNPGTFAVKKVSTDIYPNTITAIMGPSGCGKSTLLRAINRMHDLYSNIKTTGEIILKGMSIYENVLAGYKLNGIRLSKKEKDEIVEQSLKSVALWDEVKDVMSKRGSFLSGGQQQRLCIARALALKPEVLLMDEPTSALDPISTNKIEELLLELKQNFTIIVVTHNMSQAARVSDNSMFMYLGELIEHGNTTQMFTKPKNKRTEEYLTGVFG